MTTAAEFESRIKEANEAYYMGDEPLMTDAEFDTLKRALEELYVKSGGRPENSVLNTVGAPAPENAQKHRHAVPMLSLSNAFDKDDVVDFWRQVGASAESPVYGELKLDGLSLSLTYRNRKLVKATTRGDGEVGEDMTSRLERLSGVPAVLSSVFRDELIEIRGEVCLTHEAFNAVNILRQEKNKSVFANPRNAAAGLFRRDERENVDLVFFAYQVSGAQAPYFSTQTETLSALEAEGFDVAPRHTILRSVSDAMAWFESISMERVSLPVDIDGIVYKLDDTQKAKALGQRSTSPRWAIAHKFPPDRVWTRIRSIDIQVGRTGTLAPVARLEPVTVGGVVVSNATLHNKDYIEGRDSFGNAIRDGVDIRVGDWVEVYRSGDVIPRIGSVDLKRREQSEPYVFPQVCPACGAHVIQEPGEAAVRCPGSWSCPPQQLRAMGYAFSREALNVDGVSEQSFALWVDWGWVRAPADVFSLSDRYGHDKAVSLSRQKGWGRSSAQKAFDAIDAARKARLDKVLVALGMPFVGKSSARLLAQNFETFEDFHAAAKTGDPVLLAIDGIGGKMVQALKDFWADAASAEAALDLVACLEIENPLVVSTDDAILSDWVLVFTGKMPGKGRDAASEQARALGATVSGSVSKKTTVLVAGEGGGSKLKKAEAAGVTVWSPAQWEACLAAIEAGDLVEKP